MPKIIVLEICILVAAPIAGEKGVPRRRGNWASWGFIPVAQAVGLAPSPRPPPCNPTMNKLFHPIFDPRGRSSRRVRELGTGPALGPKNGGPSPDSGTDGRGTSIAPPNDAIHSTV